MAPLPPLSGSGAAASPFVGSLVNVLLVGILLSQASTYYTIYSRTEKPRSLYLFIPALVGLVVAAAGCHLAFAYHELTGHRGFVSLASTRQTVAIPLLLLCEGWVWRRAHNITQSRAVAIFGAVGVVAATGFQALTAAFTIFNNYRESLRWTQAWAWTTAGLVLFLHGSAIYSLCASRNSAVSSRVHYVLSALIRGAILAALPVVLCTLGVSISLLAGRDTSAYVPFAEVVPTLFACSILFTLNARQHISLHSSTLTSPLRPFLTSPSTTPASYSPTDRRGSLGVLIDRFKLDLPAFPAPAAPSAYERRGSREMEKQAMLSVYRLDYGAVREGKYEGSGGEMERRWSNGSEKSEGTRVGFVV
ncbi:hypothetical protein BCR35DRAFT_329238 [Leucosporidium creatinivorum]|uniref:Uncharacterized protein n=1 Tax=Leucosporidium creatinivorum TaxID=106004 RepID=A0A1Y2G0C4_9BASI|nr:hypothetical protein BCR35DRAFT_329238 [Leucosporidium creatinivorum]